MQAHKDPKSNQKIAPYGIKVYETMDNKAKMKYLNDKVNCGEFNVSQAGNVLTFKSKDGKTKDGKEITFERAAPKNYRLRSDK